MTNENARKVLQELWRHERNDWHSIEVSEALDRAIKTLGELEEPISPYEQKRYAHRKLY